MAFAAFTTSCPHKEKCYKYWPEEGKKVTFASITVQCLGAMKSEDYIARSLEVSMKRVSEVEFKLHLN